MKDYEFIAAVRRRAELGSAEEAAEVTHTVLDVLGQRLNGVEPFDLGSQLPASISQALDSSVDQPAQTFGIHEFVERVARRQHESPEEARRYATAVLTTLAEAVTPGELNQLISQLPSGYAELFGHRELA